MMVVFQARTGKEEQGVAAYDYWTVVLYALVELWYMFAGRR